MFSGVLTSPFQAVVGHEKTGLGFQLDIRMTLKLSHCSALWMLLLIGDFEIPSVFFGGVIADD